MAEQAPKTLPMLRGERVWLRASEPQDIIETSAQINDGEVGHFLGAKVPMSRAAAERFAAEIMGQVGKTIYPFSIRHLDDDRALGGIWLRDYDPQNGSAELAVVLGDKQDWSQGYGTDAVRTVCDFGFGELRLERIVLHVFDYNPRAVRAYEKVGFVTEATLRRARFHRGAFHDVHLMAFIRDDWLARGGPHAWERTEGGG